MPRLSAFLLNSEGMPAFSFVLFSQPFLMDFDSPVHFLSFTVNFSFRIDSFSSTNMLHHLPSYENKPSFCFISLWGIKLLLCSPLQQNFFDSSSSLLISSQSTLFAFCLEHTTKHLFVKVTHDFDADRVVSTSF